MLGLAEKVDLLHVPYKGGSPVMVDLLGKRISMAFISSAGAKPQVESGKLRPIAVTTQRRSALFPDVPAIADSIAEFEVNSWYGLMAPGGTPRDILDRLNAETVKVLAAPDVVQSLRGAGLDIEGSSREQFAERIRKDLARWSSFVKATGITAN
jgi:tripartite-type tricarboxylate transporter receptor subunit TctC